VSEAAPLVSVVTIFLDAERFLAEAVESVRAQSHREWELLLVDDGSRDGGTEMARAWARAQPVRVRALEHPDHANRGMSASRNLALRHARGAYVAFLDADDVWLPEKLERQVALLDRRPEAAMTYGPARLWHGWTGRPEDAARDAEQDVRIAAGRLVAPPDLLPVYLGHEDAVPSPSGVLARRSAVDAVGGFEDEFRGMYEDQVFYFKIGLAASALVSREGWYRYRQHPNSAYAVAIRDGRRDAARRAFLDWALAHARHRSAPPAIERLVARERARLEPPGSLRSAARVVARRWLPPGARRVLRGIEDAFLGRR